MIERIFSILSLGMRNEIKAVILHIAACLIPKINMLSTEFERPDHMPWPSIIVARLKSNENSPAIPDLCRPRPVYHFNNSANGCIGICICLDVWMLKSVGCAINKKRKFEFCQSIIPITRNRII